MFAFGRQALTAGALALVVLTTTTAARAQSREEISCRSTISKQLGKFVSSVFKEIISCHQSRSTGRLPLGTNCNDAFAIPDGKVVAAYEKASIAMLDNCPDELTSVLAQYARCPSPHSNLDDDDLTSGIDTLREATDCVLNIAATLANGATATVLGHPLTLPSKEAAKCQRAAGKALRKRIDTIGKARRGCQSDLDRASGGIDYSCATFDDGRIAANVAAFDSAVAQACDVPQDDLAVLGGCGQTVAQIQSCTKQVATALGGGLVAEAYELPSTCKLGHADLLLNAGFGAKQTSTQFEVGYNGLGHEVDLVDGFHGAVDLACDDDCVNCDVTIDPVKEEPHSFCRCDADAAIHCDTINGPDMDDCAGGGCTCMFAPPLPLSASGIAACVVNKLVAELDGTADGGTGVSTTTVYNTSVVYLGNSALSPCPVCTNDETSNDGVRGGTCSGGFRNGQPCDQNAESPDFGAVSYECPPSPGQNVSGAGLELKFDLTSVASPTIGTDLIDVTNGPVEVYCLQCSGNPAVGCSSDAECAEAGIGTCTLNTGPPAHANSCDDGICTVASGPMGHGTCEGNELDLFCDGALRQGGGGLLVCGSNADCATLDAVCPGGSCGNCEYAQRRQCFPAPFGAVGSDGAVGSTPSSGIYGADLAGTLCVPPTASNSVNSSVGLPGPARLHLDFEFLGRCGSDDTVAFEQPGGSNCP